MWIVKLGLERPYTFIVGAMLVLVFGILSVISMPTDIFPEIKIPVVTIIWSYAGLAPEDMERRIVTVDERAMTTTVSDIEHIESQTVNGVSVVKVFFQPGASIDAAVSQITAISQAVVRAMPPGSTPPLIIRFNASNVPILQASLSSHSMSEQQMYDYGLNFIRTQMATVQGAQVPLPFGGKVRQIMVDINPQALFAKGLSPADVSAAINAQNLVLPGGTAKLGAQEYTVHLNSSPDAIEALNDIPIKEVNGAPVYVHDVAQVHDGFAVQTNIVRENGQRGALITVLKGGGASTLDVVKRVRERLPQIMATLPSELHVNLLSDQSLFVRASLNGVVREAVIAAVLTALMILLFLGSWRTTLIVALSIPLAIFCSIIALGALGQTINVMTLGGLALAVGILVDDATVAIENIHRNAQLGKPLLEAILDGAQQIAVPTFVSTLSICVVFVPVFFLTGAAGSLFAPLAMAVIFAMMASYIISRTLVPTLVRFAMESEHGMPQPRWLEAITTRFERSFDAFKARYARNARDGAGASPRGGAELCGARGVLGAAHSRDRAGLLSRGRRGADPAAHARAAGHAAGADGADRGDGREDHAPRAAAERGADDSRQHRDRDGRNEPRFQRQSDDRHGGRRAADDAVARSEDGDGGRRGDAAQGAARAVSGDHLLLSERRHRRTDSELRAAGADRHPGGGREQGGELRGGAGASRRR